MRFWIVLFTLLTLPLFGCTNHQNGTVTGTVSPPSQGVRIIALRSAQQILSADANPHDGSFSMSLPPGSYDISIHAPSSLFPLVFPDIRVNAGKTTSLSRIELAGSTGHAVLNGRISPVGDKTTVTLYEEGRERAAVQTDKEGRYEFVDLPSGTYSLKVSTPEYAQDTVDITVAEDQVATNNFRLLHADKINGVDWSAGTIRVTGTGLPPSSAANAAAASALAQRAAIADGQRNLLRVLDQIKISPNQNLKSYWGKDKYTVTIRGFIQGYKIIEERKLEGGKIEVVLELPLSGRSGLMHYLNEQH